MAKSVIDEILNNKEDLLLSFLRVMEGKEAKAKFNLDGMEFKIGNTKVEMNGAVEFRVIPIKHVPKKKR